MPNVPFIPSRACPGTEHRKRNDPLRGNETVIVWRSAGRRIRVRRPLTTKSWFVFPRFSTTNRTVEPAGTDLLERVKAKSRASTRTVMVLELAATVDPGRSAQAERATLVVTSETTTHPLGTTFEGYVYSRTPASMSYNVLGSGQQPRLDRRFVRGLDVS
jgi:hypothetical protein